MAQIENVAHHKLGDALIEIGKLLGDETPGNVMRWAEHNVYKATFKQAFGPYVKC
ncbi:MAG: hypothetical protein AAGA21_00590 [Pseudomonadota bacterium]